MTQFLNGVLEGSMKKLRKATEFSLYQKRRDPVYPDTPWTPEALTCRPLTCAQMPTSGPYSVPLLCSSSYPKGSPAGPSAVSSLSCPRVTCLNFQGSALSPGFLLTPSPALLDWLTTPFLRNPCHQALDRGLPRLGPRGPHPCHLHAQPSRAATKPAALVRRSEEQRDTGLAHGHV